MLSFCTWHTPCILCGKSLYCIPSFIVHFTGEKVNIFHFFLFLSCYVYAWIYSNCFTRLFTFSPQDPSAILEVPRVPSIADINRRPGASQQRSLKFNVEMEESAAFSVCETVIPSSRDLNDNGGIESTSGGFFTKIISKKKGEDERSHTGLQRFVGNGVKHRGKLIGTDIVPNARDESMCQDSMMKLKGFSAAARARGIHKQRIVLSVCLDGIRITDEKTGVVQHEHSLQNISFIAMDTTDHRALGYVFGQTGEHRFFAIKTIQPAHLVINDLRELVQLVQARIHRTKQPSHEEKSEENNVSKTPEVDLVELDLFGKMSTEPGMASPGNVGPGGNWCDFDSAMDLGCTQDKRVPPVLTNCSENGPQGRAANTFENGGHFVEPSFNTNAFNGNPFCKSIPPNEAGFTSTAMANDVFPSTLPSHNAFLSVEESTRGGKPSQAQSHAGTLLAPPPPSTRRGNRKQQKVPDLVEILSADLFKTGSPDGSLLQEGSKSVDVFAVAGYQLSESQVELFQNIHSEVPQPPLSYSEDRPQTTSTNDFFLSQSSICGSSNGNPFVNKLTISGENSFAQQHIDLTTSASHAAPCTMSWPLGLAPSSTEALMGGAALGFLQNAQGQNSALTNRPSQDFLLSTSQAFPERGLPLITEFGQNQSTRYPQAIQGSSSIFTGAFTKSPALDFLNTVQASSLPMADVSTKYYESGPKQNNAPIAPAKGSTQHSLLQTNVFECLDPLSKDDGTKTSKESFKNYQWSRPAVTQQASHGLSEVSPKGPAGSSAQSTAPGIVFGDPFGMG
uniref:disabled homolog 2-like isoform X1 n=2 Tax=Myxine glutinosa TaxID=7769 RepID=UPI00358DEC3C